MKLVLSGLDCHRRMCDESNTRVCGHQHEMRSNHSITIVIVIVFNGVSINCPINWSSIAPALEGRTFGCCVFFFVPIIDDDECDTTPIDSKI